ncbi:Pentatricopeptide repeat [Trema orientale]|uniref:Pentatricopeptide repeat n=1 Tax=Trema orientale TaxID=63057 RepID=A0A2P5CKU0_TREOI|nr:Pentatricopeptide repeat [Trema orientale]
MLHKTAIYVLESLITMYSKCGSLSYARYLFDRSPNRDLATWNSILAALSQSADTGVENIQEGFSVFRRLRESIVSTSRLTLAPVLKLCLHSGYIWASEAVHGYAVKIGLEWDVFVSGALVNIYSKFGRIGEARALFDRMPERDVVLWNVMLKAYLGMGLERQVLYLFSEFHRSGLRPDDVTMRCVISGINRVGSDKCSRYLEQVQAYSTKFSMYNNDSDVFSWNKTLSEYLQVGENWLAVECFLNMIRSKVKCDVVTLVVILSAVVGTHDLGLGKQIHAFAVKSGFDFDVSVANSLINMYSKSGSSGLEEESVNLFRDLLDTGLVPDQFTLASVLRACSSLREGLSLARQVHVHAVKIGRVADRFVSTALIDVYSRSEKMEEAEVIFHKKVGFDLASWNAMMFGYITSNKSHKALELLSLMHKIGETANEITLATATKAAGSLVALEQGKQIHGHGRQIHANVIKLDCSSDPFVGTSLVDMYAKCGGIEDAYCLFKRMDVKTIALWNALLVGLAQHGNAQEALNLFRYMVSNHVEPDRVTFVGVLSACSYSGLISETYGYFSSMHKDYDLCYELTNDN